MHGGRLPLPTDFQALSFTSPQPLLSQPATYDERGLTCLLRHDATDTHNTNMTSGLPRFTESQKTKCPRQRVTQAFCDQPP